MFSLQKVIGQASANFGIFGDFRHLRFFFIYNKMEKISGLAVDNYLSKFEVLFLQLKD